MRAPAKASARPGCGEPAPSLHLLASGAQVQARGQRAFGREIARLAVGCLHAELVLHPKPGLVSPVDNGSHDDMTPATFMRSLFALRHYFARICQAGGDDAPFAALRQLGIEAEASMLRATGGVNTHRGAIFSLGMICAAAGRAHAQGIAVSAASLRAIVLICWGDALAAHTQAPGGASHGQLAAARHAASGAREEGALGFPSIFEVGLPALRATLRAGRGMRHARVDTLFALMAHISDTNVYHRGGQHGAATVKLRARQFMARGGSANPHWQAEALACHDLFVAQRWSPGGAADLLAATCLVHALCGADRPWPAAC